MPVRIEPFQSQHIEGVKKLTDKEIGKNYYSLSELQLKEQQSRQGIETASFVLLSDDELVGIRLSFPANQWKKGKGEKLSAEAWPHPLKETAYFQSLFLSPSYQKQGWGQKLSLKSLEVLKKLGAKGVVCHSWVESPGDSSRKYLQSLQFESICQYPEYWKFVDYICPRCGKPCLCTAEEMYLDLSKEPL